MLGVRDETCQAERGMAVMGLAQAKEAHSGNAQSTNKASAGAAK